MLYKRIFNFISVCKILSEIKTNRQIQYFATVLFHSLAWYGGKPTFFIYPTLRWCGVCCWRCWIVVVLFYHLNSISCKRKQTANDSKGFKLSEYVCVCVYACMCAPRVWYVWMQVRISKMWTLNSAIISHIIAIWIQYQYFRRILSVSSQM